MQWLYWSQFVAAFGLGSLVGQLIVALILISRR